MPDQERDDALLALLRDLYRAAAQGRVEWSKAGVQALTNKLPPEDGWARSEPAGLNLASVHVLYRLPSERRPCQCDAKPVNVTVMGGPDKLMCPKCGVQWEE